MTRPGDPIAYREAPTAAAARRPAAAGWLIISRRASHFDDPDG
jgi:hypothetical protein